MTHPSVRPQLDLLPTATDRWLDGLGFASLIALIALPAYWYNALPEQIPKHFNLNGEADAWGAKSGIWILPAIGTVLFALLTYLNRKPHTFNYMTTITPDNAEHQYRNAMTMIRVLRLLILLLFLYLVWGTVGIGLGRQSGLGEPFSLLMVLTIEVAALFFVTRSLNMKPQNVKGKI